MRGTGLESEAPEHQGPLDQGRERSALICRDPRGHAADQEPRRFVGLGHGFSLTLSVDSGVALLPSAQPFLTPRVGATPIRGGRPPLSAPAGLPRVAGALPLLEADIDLAAFL